MVLNFSCKGKNALKSTGFLFINVFQPNIECKSQKGTKRTKSIPGEPKTEAAH